MNNENKEHPCKTCINQHEHESKNVCFSCIHSAVRKDNYVEAEQVNEALR